SGGHHGLAQPQISWRLSNSLDTDFCVAALEEALENYGTPEIFNTDQGSRQFTSYSFTQILKEARIKIFMDWQGTMEGQHNDRTTLAIAQV
ncbi:MAG: transposase family protein, partial [Desulfobulbaceae bacterium]|nr:transposase family protein [Desulfobulbaceae bacterium]